MYNTISEWQAHTILQTGFQAGCTFHNFFSTLFYFKGVANLPKVKNYNNKKYCPDKNVLVSHMTNQFNFFTRSRKFCDPMGRSHLNVLYIFEEFNFWFIIKMITFLTFTGIFAFATGSELVRRPNGGQDVRDLNPNCPDLDLWHECTTICSAEMIECITDCNGDQDCISTCNRQNVNCEHRK